MPCPNCGSQTSDDADQCPACGLQLAARPSSQTSWNAPGGGSWGAPAPGDTPQGTGPDAWGPPPTGERPAWSGQGGGSYGGVPPWGSSGGAGSGGGQPYTPYPTSGWGNQPEGSKGQLAGWWRRVWATLLDGIIIGIPAEIINVAAGRAAYWVFLIVATAVYTTFMLSTRGQTIGMMAVGTECILESTGARLATGQAFLRWLVAELLDVTVVGGILDILWPLWDQKNQTLHDKAVSSLVIRTR
jgi:uncharacterized RDD family membrane protein YckC